MIENKYLLTMMLAKRVKQLNAGYKPLVETKNKKPILIALQEISEGKVYLKDIQASEKSEELEKADELFSENIT